MSYGCETAILGEGRVSGGEAGWDLSCLFEQRRRPNSQLPLCSLVKPQSLSLDCSVGGERTTRYPLWAAATLSLGYFRGTMKPLSAACYSAKTWAQTGLLVSGVARGFIHHNSTLNTD